jgi:hypothetical protein
MGGLGLSLDGDGSSSFSTRRSSSVGRYMPPTNQLCVRVCGVCVV